MTPLLNFSFPAERSHSRSGWTALLAGSWIFLATPVCQADWAQFLGPTRDGVYSGPPITSQWPKEGPRKLWSQPVGHGFSGPIVQGNRVFLHHRLQDEEVLECFDAVKGTSLWKSGSPTTYVDDFGFDPGPRATPAVAGSTVVTLGADGQVEAREAQAGKLLWAVNSRRELGARKGFFGLAPSPLIAGDQVFVHVGGEDGTSVVALDLKTGKLRWKTGGDEASYASPILVSAQGQPRLLVLTREALVSLDPASGKSYFRFPWRPSTHASVSAATPLWVDGQILLSASYDTGATLLDYADAGAKKRWETQDAISSHYSSLVHHQGFVFGFDGRQEQGCDLRCIELRTGKVRWTEKRTGAGHIILTGSSLLILTEKGELLLAPASAEGFKPTARAQILPFLARAHPALSDGRFYARGKDRLFSFDLTASSTSP